MGVLASGARSGRSGTRTWSARTCHSRRRPWRAPWRLRSSDPGKPALEESRVQAWRRRRRREADGGLVASSLHLRWPRCAFGVCLWRGPGAAIYARPTRRGQGEIERKATLTWGKRQDKCPSAGLCCVVVCACVRTRREGMVKRRRRKPGPALLTADLSIFNDYLGRTNS